MQPPPEVTMERAETLQELWNGFNLARVAFLDLQKMAVADACGLSAVGPRACLAGDLHLVPGQFGASSQVSPADVLESEADAFLQASWHCISKACCPVSAVES